MHIISSLVLLAAPCWAQKQITVYDVNQTQVFGNSQVGNGLNGGHHEALGPLLAFNEGFLLVAQTSDTGRELWFTDGASAHVVANLASGSASSQPDWLTPFGELVLFGAKGDNGQAELWKTDGTESGTQLVADPDPLTGLNPTGLTVLGGKVLLSAFTPSTGYELWSSDGTDAGTQLVKDLNPGPMGSAPYNLTLSPSGQAVFFVAKDAANERQLWRSDGTAAGTVSLGKPDPQIASPLFGAPFAWQGKLYFGASTSAGWELCESDGTAAGTQLLLDLMPGSGGSNVDLSSAVEFGGQLYFAADTGNGTRLQRFDGTAVTEVGTVELPAAMTELGGWLYFVGSAPGIGRELWRTDGTSAGTTLVVDTSPGYLSGFGVDSASLLAHAGKLWFGASVNHHYRLWTTDGVTTTMLAPAPGLSLGLPTSNITGLASGAVIFGQPASQAPDGLWMSDVANGSFALKLPIQGPPKTLNALVDHAFSPEGQSVYFTAQGDGIHAGRLYHWDPIGGVRLVRDHRWSTQPFGHLNFQSIWNGRTQMTFFLAEVDPFGLEPWATDGTAGGTMRLVNGSPGHQSSTVKRFVAHGSRAFFVVEEPWDALYVSDGTQAGTRPVFSPTTGFPGTLYSDGLLSLGDWLVFLGQTSSGQQALYRTDGSAGGTALIQLLDGNATVDAPSQLTRWGDHAVFAAYSAGVGVEPMITDGTTANRLADLLPGSAGSDPSHFRVLNGELYCVGKRAPNGLGLWKFASPSSAPVFLGEFAPKDSTVVVQNLVTSAAGVYARVSSASQGQRLWRSAGLPGDLVQVDLGAGPTTPYVMSLLVPAGRGVYVGGGGFSVGGYTLFYVDDQGVRIEFGPDVFPTSLPRPFTVANGKLFFAGHFPAYGKELASIPVLEAYALDIGGGTAGIELAMTAPFLGGTLEVDITGIPANAPGALLFSRPVPARATTLLAREGANWLDLTWASVLTPVMGAPHAHKSFAVPAAPALAGKQVHAQGLFFPNGAWPALATNGVSLHLGY